MTVLILRALGLGDLLTALPALRALADAFPRHRRVLATPLALAPLASLSGAIDDVIDAAPLAPLRWSSAARVDVAVNLHGRGPESHRVLQALAPRRLIAFAHPAIDAASPSRWRADEHEVTRWCRLLEEHGISADPSRLDLDVPSGSVPTQAIGATVLHPGAAHAARRWPASRWSAVARAEVGAGRQVVITGSDADAPVAHRIATSAGLARSAVLAGQTGLVELARVVKAAARVICGDTGVAHLATAVGTPSVVLFGPTAPDRWGPPPARVQHRVLWAGLTGRPDAERVDAGLLRITPDMVVAALRDLPSGARDHAAHAPVAV